MSFRLPQQCLYRPVPPPLGCFCLCLFQGKTFLDPPLVLCCIPLSLVLPRSMLRFRHSLVCQLLVQPISHLCNIPVPRKTILFLPRFAISELPHIIFNSVEQGRSLVLVLATMTKRQDNKPDYKQHAETKSTNIKTLKTSSFIIES